jgi:anti-anti-sigma factor
MQQSKTEISVEIGEAAAVLDIRGDVTVATEPALFEAHEKACRQGAQRILLKMTEDTYVDSGGIAALLQLLVKVRESGQKAALSGVSRHNRKVLNMVGVDRLADIYNTAELALSCLDRWK